MDAYERQWKRYRRLQLHSWIAFAGFGLSAFVIVLAKLPSKKYFIVVLLFWVYSAVAGSLLRQFPCPRCGRYFEKRWPWQRRFAAGCCPHCGLKKSADPEA